MGGAAIAVGVCTYSKKVMITVGTDIYELSPISAFVVVLSSSIILFLFASKSLKSLLDAAGLPSFPIGWIATPLIAAVVSHIALFIVQMYSISSLNRTPLASVVPMVNR